MIMNLIPIKNSREKHGTPKINVAHTGCIKFSKEFCKVTGITNVNVGFYQDDKNPKDWYVSFGDKEPEPTRKDREHRGLLLNAATVARAILKANEITDKAKHFAWQPRRKK